MSVPSNLIPTTITQLPEAPVASPSGYFPIVIAGTTYKVQFSQISANVTVPPSRRVNAGTGLTGGGSLSADITIAVANGGITDTQLDTTGVAAGTYGSDTAIPVITVSDRGRVTSVSTSPITITGYVPTTRTITAGNGLTGGGTLAADRTLAANYATSAPLSVGSATVGTSVQLSRGDHVHPAIDLSDSAQTTGVLPMGRGGTGNAMAPVAGAVAYSNGSYIDLTNPGTLGYVLYSNGTAAPDWVDPGTLDVAQADNLNGGAANRIAYQTAPDTTGFLTAPTVTDTYLRWNGSAMVWSAVAGAGTVTSVDGSGGTTGLTVSGGPITAAGTLTLGGTLAISAGGTGLGGTPTNGQLLIGDGTGFSLSALSAGSGISIANATGSISIANTAPDQTVTLTGSTAISVSGTYPSFTLTNTAPDQTVILTGTGGTSISGTYPSFTVNSTAGTVTSVDGSSTVSGFTLGGGPITSSGVLTLAGTLGIASGGTGLGTTPTNGQLLIGNGTGFTLTQLTAGTNVTITSGTGSITIAASGGGGGNAYAWFIAA